MLRTINHKVIGAGAAVMVLCTASAGAGLWSTTRLDGALQDANVSSAVLRNHMEADMMHDALRADVLSSQLAGDASSGIAVDDVRKDLATHTQIFRKAIADNDVLATDPASRAVDHRPAPALAVHSTMTAAPAPITLWLIVRSIPNPCVPFRSGHLRITGLTVPSSFVAGVLKRRSETKGRAWRTLRGDLSPAGTCPRVDGARP